MATIYTSQYADDVARTAGEAIVVDSGSIFTIRTDSRIHANKPATYAGSFGSVSYGALGGIYNIDATNVRWLPFNTGGGSIPAIGTMITQGAVSGYFLGTWDSNLAYASSVMPSTGFIKLREKYNGNFGAGALGGISASATEADKTGWIEVVYDAASNFTIPRVGKFAASGDWFYLDNTNGRVGQQLLVPTTSAPHQFFNFCPGVWIEKAPNSGEYDFWTGLNASANGWWYTHLGHPSGNTDARTKFVKTIGSGILQIGEPYTLNMRYLTNAVQNGTYATAALACTYIYSGDAMYLSTGTTTSHLLDDNQQVGIQVLSGGGATGTYTANVIDPFNFSVPYPGVGASGYATMRAGVDITFTAHGLLEGEYVYCDFTTGTGADGTYKMWKRNSANGYTIAYPHTAALTGGNVSCRHTVAISGAAHGLDVGRDVFCQFLSGAATSGIYTMRSTYSAQGFFINSAQSTATSGYVNVQFTVGHIPQSGCKTRIPNILISECATATRGTNSIPNATIASRPEITTTAAGELDLSHLYCYSLYTGAIGQAYACKIHNSALQETLNISEVAAPLDINNVGIGMYGAQDLITLTIGNCYAGGYIRNLVAHRGNAPGTNDHAISISVCNGITFDNIKCGIVQYARSTGYPLNITTCQSLTMNNLQLFNGPWYILTSVDLAVNNLDYNDRYVGKTNATTPYYIFNVNSACDNIIIDGVTLGLYNTISNCHPYNGIFYTTTATNIIFRNAGTYLNPLDTKGNWGYCTYATSYLFYPAGSNIGVKAQKIFANQVRTGATYSINSNKNILIDRLMIKNTMINSGTGTPRTYSTLALAELNDNVRGISYGYWPSTGQTSVYGTHFFNMFRGKGSNIGTYLTNIDYYSSAIVLAMNEPTSETTTVFTKVAGNVVFNSSGGVEMRQVGCQAIWEMLEFAKGHTGFAPVLPIMSGGTIARYTLEYQIDTGSGWNGSWKTMTIANLTSETISPSTGFKLKIRITTITADTAAITYLRIYTLTSESAQANIDYPLDEVTVRVTALDAITKLPVSGARVFLETSPGGVDIFNTTTDANGIVETDSYSYTANQAVVGRVRKSTSAPYYRTSDIIGTITDAGLDTTILLISDE
jgi:hypothetical protein